MVRGFDIRWWWALLIPTSVPVIVALNLRLILSAFQVAVFFLSAGQARAPNYGANLAAFTVGRVVTVSGCHVGHIYGGRTATLLTISSLYLGLLIHVGEDWSHLIYGSFLHWYPYIVLLSNIIFFFINCFSTDNLVIKLVFSIYRCNPLCVPFNRSLSTVIRLCMHQKLDVFWAIKRFGWTSSHQFLDQVSLIDRVHRAVAEGHCLVPASDVFVLVSYCILALRIFIAAILQFHNCFKIHIFVALHDLFSIYHVLFVHFCIYYSLLRWKMGILWHGSYFLHYHVEVSVAWLATFLPSLSFLARLVSLTIVCVLW